MAIKVKEIVNTGNLLPTVQILRNPNRELGAFFNWLPSVHPVNKVSKFSDEWNRFVNDLPKVSCQAPDESNFLVGLEIEAEHLKEFEHSPFPHDALWKTKMDGSLRNGGIEFISLALEPEDISPLLAVLYKYWEFIGSKPNFSWRSSIHAHINCRELSVESFKNLILLSLVFEDSLFSFASPGRRDTNIFCTPLSRSNFYALSAFLSAPNDNKYALKTALSGVSASIKKYAALNFMRLWDLGTLEFRHLRGTDDPVVVIKWCQLLSALFSAACNLPTRDIHAAIKELNTSSAYDGFLTTVFGEALANLLFSPSYAVRMSRNISVAKEILSGKEYNDSIKLNPKSGIMSFIAMEYRKAKKDKLETRTSSKKKQILQ